ncbi:MAG: hypothetical protein JXB88_21545 [Spirochaetales bacterium]|nr:hypothetical protein [Spirochaetales bacterium]
MVIIVIIDNQVVKAIAYKGRARIMHIDLGKKKFTPNEIAYINNKLQKACKKGFLTSRVENNDSLFASYKGVGKKGISPKWNIKIYDYNRKQRGHSIVCIDKLVLRRLIEEDYLSFIPPDKKVLRIDDAGWGFPLCGVMVGVSDEVKVLTATVPVEYFRDDTKCRFSTKLYLKKYSELGMELLYNFHASPGTHRIEICTGYLNQPLREDLRKTGYDVRVVEIKGLLQQELEKLFKVYVFESIGADIYYDPKDMKKADIPRNYYECLEYGKKHCPHLIKTGWSSINGKISSKKKS